MKKVFLLFTVFCFIACNEKVKSVKDAKVEVEKITEEKIDIKSIESFLTDKKANSNPVLLGWISYYKEFLSKDFAVKNFIFDEEIKINRQKSNIYAKFEKEFDKIYEPFLIYSPQKTQYIDFDSYSWQLDDLEMKNVSFNPDQEVSLVDIKTKKIERILFNGPSQWVEEAFWVDENSLILLGNDTDFNPKMIIVDLVLNKFYFFKYNTNLKEPSGYSDERLRLKGLNVPGE
jgi:hypothetical protein